MKKIKSFFVGFTKDIVPKMLIGMFFVALIAFVVWTISLNWLFSSLLVATLLVCWIIGHLIIERM